MGMVDHCFNIVDKATFRKGTSRLGASVNVVTTRSGSERYGFTASGVCSVSDTPATFSSASIVRVLVFTRLETRAISASTR